MFSYQEFITRNLGFVSEKQQSALKESTVFIVGVGGMGGTALACLARSGVGKFIIADIDVFEVSNLNRQIFSEMSVIGKDKVQIAREKILQINPEVKVEVFSNDWQQHLDRILEKSRVVINGCDDALATVKLMRKAKEHGKPVIDAFASTLPSVYVVRPEDPRPEVFLKFPTAKLSTNDFRPEHGKECGFQETIYVLTHSSTIRHVKMQYAREMLNGQRKRISMAPMVWMTGILMSYEAIKLLLGQNSRVGYRGVFLNPYELKWEKPKFFIWAWFRELLIRWWIQRLVSG